MFDRDDEQPKALTDAEVAAGARPGESWAEARTRLTRKRWADFNQGGLSADEWVRLGDMFGSIRDCCLDVLRGGTGHNVDRLVAPVLGIVEFCCALAEKRSVEVVPIERMPGHWPFDDTYSLLSRLSPREAASLDREFVGLLDILRSEDPCGYLRDLEEDGCLRMVLMMA